MQRETHELPKSRIEGHAPDPADVRRIVRKCFERLHSYILQLRRNGPVLRKVKTSKLTYEMGNLDSSTIIKEIESVIRILPPKEKS